MTESIIPEGTTLSFSQKHGSVKWRAVCIPGKPEVDWSLKSAYADEPDSLERGLLLMRIQCVAHELDIQRLYGPSVVSSSSKVVDPDLLDERIMLPIRHVPFYRKRTLPADGTFLRKPGDAFIMSGGGCPVGVFTGEGKAGGVCVVAHASRDSLIPSHFNKHGQPINPSGRVIKSCPSVIRSSAAALQSEGVELSGAAMRMLFWVKPKAFPHPVLEGPYANLNRSRVRYLKARYGEGVILDEEDQAFLDLGAIALRQADEVGITHKSAQMPLPTKAAFAHTRHKKAELRGCRNLVIVQRLA